MMIWTTLQRILSFSPHEFTFYIFYLNGKTKQAHVNPEIKPNILLDLSQ